MVSALDVMTPREHRAQRLSILDAQMKMDAAKRQAAQQQQVEQFFRQYGPGIVRGDQGALEQLGGLGSEGVKAALGVKEQQGLAASRAAATRASEASTRLDEFKLGEAQRQKAVDQITELDTALTAVEAADPSVRSLLYKQQRAEFAKRGYDVSSAPEDYDPNWVKQTRESLVPIKDRIDAYYKSPEYLRLKEEAEREPISYVRQKAEAEAAAKAKYEKPSTTAEDRQIVTLQFPDGKRRSFRRASPEVDEALGAGAVQVTGAAATGGRPLPSAAVNSLADAGARLDTLDRLTTTFQDDYGGSPFLGAAENVVGRMFGGRAGAQSQWWQDYQSYVNEVRHGLFGAALTPSEQREFDRANVNPGMAPSQIRSNLARQKLIAERAASRRANAYKAQGYSGVDEAVGREFQGATGQSFVTQGAQLPEEARRQLREGQPTQFRNGQVWMLSNGQPVRVR